MVINIVYVLLQCNTKGWGVLAQLVLLVTRHYRILVNGFEPCDIYNNIFYLSLILIQHITIYLLMIATLIEYLPKQLNVKLNKSLMSAAFLQCKFAIITYLIRTFLSLDLS